MSRITGTPPRRKLSVSIAEDLAEYAAGRAARDASSVSEVVNEGLNVLRTRERNQLAATSYAQGADDAREWREAAAPLFWEAIEGEDGDW